MYGGNSHIYGPIKSKLLTIVSSTEKVSWPLFRKIKIIKIVLSDNRSNLYASNRFLESSQVL